MLEKKEKKSHLVFPKAQITLWNVLLWAQSRYIQFAVIEE